MNKVIGIIAGSLRRESFSKKIAMALVPMAPVGYTFQLVSIDDLPLYNQDFDDHGPLPPAYHRFREEIKALDGVIFVTPEHNRSIPAALKNAIDIASRPKEKNAWNGKPGAVFSNSPGNISAFGANHHLRQCLVFLNVPVMQQPEVYLAHVNNLLDEHGALRDEQTKTFLQKAIDAYIDWHRKLTA